MQESVGASRGLGFIWNHRRVTLEILSMNSNWISGVVTSMKSNLKFILINIYGRISNIEKRVVWEEISQFLKNRQKNLIFLEGDFNTIINLNEKLGGSQYIPQSSKDF